VIYCGRGVVGFRSRTSSQLHLRHGSHRTQEQEPTPVASIKLRIPSSGSLICISGYTIAAVSHRSSSSSVPDTHPRLTAKVPCLRQPSKELETSSESEGPVRMILCVFLSRFCFNYVLNFRVAVSKMAPKKSVKRKRMSTRASETPQLNKKAWKPRGPNFSYVQSKEKPIR
jgi:hypothetical protein